MIKNFKLSNGFTLVELSIVIIIIGFLIAGISAGQSLIKQARLNGVINEMDKLTFAINTFRSTYGFFAGDFPDAFAMWGTRCAPNSSQCDGNGDGLDVWNQFTNADCPNMQEPLHAWVHLKLAGLITGNFSGVCSGNGESLDDIYPSLLGGNATWNTGVGRDSAEPEILGLTNAGGADYADDGNPVLSTNDAQNIDAKVDDGLPLTGLITGSDGYGPVGGCVDVATNSYVLTQGALLSCTLTYHAWAGAN